MGGGFPVNRASLATRPPSASVRLLARISTHARDSVSSVRAIVVDKAGAPRLDEVPEPEGEGELVRILACGLCGSDVEKLTPAHAGAVLGHEVVARAEDGSRVVLLHHRPCGRVRALPRRARVDVRVLRGADDPAGRLRRARAVGRDGAGRERRPRRRGDLRRAARVRPARGAAGSVRTRAGRGPGLRRDALRCGAAAARRRGVRRRRASGALRARAGRACRRGRPLRARRRGRGGARGRPRRHGARLRGRGHAAARRRLPARAPPRRLALSDAGDPRRGGRPPPRARRARADGAPPRTLRGRAGAVPERRGAEGRVRSP